MSNNVSAATVYMGNVVETDQDEPAHWHAASTFLFNFQHKVFSSCVQAPNTIRVDMALSQSSGSQNSCTSPSQLFLATEEELRDVKRVHSHGQEEDLRLALQVVI